MFVLKMDSTSLVILHIPEKKLFLESQTAYRYDCWKCESISERILLFEVTLAEFDLGRQVDFSVGVNASTPYRPLMLNLWYRDCSL